VTALAIENDVAHHYGNREIAERILAALRMVNGPDATVTVDALSMLDHFHGRGILATREAVELLSAPISERGCSSPSSWLPGSPPSRRPGMTT
jgi:hypothetical protein